MSVRDVVTFNEDELTEERLEEKKAAVLEVLESIRKHERVGQPDARQARRAAARDRACTRSTSRCWPATASRLPGRCARWNSAPCQHDRLVGVIKETVDEVVALEREIHKLNRSLETPRRLEDAKAIKKRIKQLETRIRADRRGGLRHASPS